MGVKYHAGEATEITGDPSGVLCQKHELNGSESNGLLFKIRRHSIIVKEKTRYHSINT